MRKIIMFSLFIAFLTAGAAYCLNLKPVAFWYDFDAHAATVLIADLEAGREWIVREGDVIAGGWTVAEITPEYVVISRYLEDQGYTVAHKLYFEDDSITIKKGPKP